MCYPSLNFVTTNNLDHPRNTQINPEPHEPHQIKYVFQSNRRSTDQYWIILFAVIFVTWIVSWHYLIIQHEKDYKSNVHINLIAHNSSKNFYDATAKKIKPHNNTILNNISELFQHYWIICTIACDIRFLDAHYEKRGAVIIWGNVLFCIFLIAYAFASISSDNTFYHQLNYFSKFFTLLLFHYRIFMFFLNDFTTLKKFAIHYDKKIAFWVVPEVILIIIRASKKLPEQDEEENVDEDSRKISFRKLMRSVSEISLTLVLLLKVLTFITATNVSEIHLNNPLLYTIVGGSCYVGFTLFYLGLMIISCATSIALNSPVDIQKMNLFLRASYIVGRYHFGTACYHGTLLFPRLHAAFIVNEVAFRKATNFSTINRLCVTQRKLHNVSLVVTAVCGANYAESIRELLHFSTYNLLRVKNFQGFAGISRKFLTICVGVNSLVLTLLWMQGVIHDPSFPIGTWVMIFITVFLTYMYMKADDAVFDTIWFHIDDQDIVKF